MHRDMSVDDMLNGLSFVVAKSRVIVWKMIDSGNYDYSLAELRNHLGKEKVDAWLNHPLRRDFQTLEHALQFFYECKHYQLYGSGEFDSSAHVPHVITPALVIAMIENTIARLEAECATVNKIPSWGLNLEPDAPLPWGPKNEPAHLTLIERLRAAWRKREELPDRYEQRREEERAKRASQVDKKTRPAEAARANGYAKFAEGLYEIKQQLLQELAEPPPAAPEIDDPSPS